MKQSVRRIIGSAAELKVSSASLKRAVRLGDTEKIKRQFRRLKKRITGAQQMKILMTLAPVAHGLVRRHVRSWWKLT
jgi:hypothetical protein